MKKTLLNWLSVALMLIPLGSQAQWIQGFTVDPPNPTTATPVTVYVGCMFPSSGCDDYSLFQSIQGNQIYASALHCLGLLTTICNYTDTVSLGLLPAGAYTFHFQLDAGQGPSPCTPGIVAGPNDSVTFVVSPAVGVGEHIGQDAYTIFPNPAGDRFRISGLSKQSGAVTVRIYDLKGQQVRIESLPDPDAFVDISTLPYGAYQVEVQLNGERQAVIPLVRTSRK